MIAKNKVNAMELKYATVKGSRGPESRCLAYVTGPIKTAHEAKKSTDPKDHLRKSCKDQLHDLVFRRQ